MKEKIAGKVSNSMETLRSKHRARRDAKLEAKDQKWKERRDLYRLHREMEDAQAAGRVVLTLQELDAKKESARLEELRKNLGEPGELVLVTVSDKQGEWKDNATKLIDGLKKKGLTPDSETAISLFSIQSPFNAPDSDPNIKLLYYARTVQRQLIEAGYRIDTSDPIQYRPTEDEPGGLSQIGEARGAGRNLVRGENNKVLYIVFTSAAFVGGLGLDYRAINGGAASIIEDYDGRSGAPGWVNVVTGESTTKLGDI